MILALTGSRQIGVGRIVSRKNGQKQDHLGNDAASTGTSTVGIDGSRGRGLMLGSIRDDGEEGSKRIH
jgi:hypothetical protein